MQIVFGLEIMVRGPDDWRLELVKTSSAAGNEPMANSEPADAMPQHQCPCCDFITLFKRGNHLICPVCFWEDDGQDVDTLDSPSESNRGTTLRQGRGNFKQFGACEEAMAKYVVPVENRSHYECRQRNIG